MIPMARSHHKTRAHADRKADPSKPVQPTRREREALQERARLQLESIRLDNAIERGRQGEIIEEIKRKHQGNISVPAIWDVMADRRITIHGAGPLAARG